MIMAQVRSTTPLLSSFLPTVRATVASNMNVFLQGAVATLGLQFSGFAVAALLQTEVFYDILGGCNFLLLAWLGWSSSLPRLRALTLCFVASRSWLLVFLAWRAHNRKGDARFDDVKHQPAMFFVYWMVQAIWVYTISLPLMVEQSARNQSSVTGLLDWSLLFGFAVSIALEVVSDIQKTMWIERGRPGGFCAEGLWKYSRHPNYAGEIFQWIFCSAFAALSGFPYWIVGLLSPLFTLQILLNTSGTGIWNAEGKNLRRHYESENASQYEEYRRTTSPLIPLVGYEFVPLWIKRNVLFEYSKYEYDPDKVRREKKE